MAIRRDNKGRFAGGGGGSGGGGKKPSQKSVANPGSKAAANRDAAKAAGLTFSAFMKQKAKAGRQVDKTQETKRLNSNRSSKVRDQDLNKMQGRSWQEVRASVRSRQGRSV